MASVMAPMGIGEVALIKNSANANLYVFPPTATETFNAGSAGAAVTIAAYAALLAVKISATDMIAVEIGAA
jgi:hypothetical protein